MEPNVGEKGITKVDYKNFRYTVDYDLCEKNKSTSPGDVVYLKNGSIIKGKIIEQVPSVSLKIQTGDGSIFVFKIEEVDRFVLGVN